MKRIIYSLSLAILFPLLTSCGKEEATPEPVPAVQPSQIEGEWFGVKAVAQMHSANNLPAGTPKTDNMVGNVFTFSGKTGYAAKYQDADTLIQTSGTYSLANGLLNIQAGKWVGFKSDLYIVDTLTAHRLVFHLKTGMPNPLGGVTSVVYTAKR